MFTRWIFALLILATGLIVGLLISRPADPIAQPTIAENTAAVPPTASPSTAELGRFRSDLQALQQMLQSEIDARRQLQRQIAELRRLLAEQQASATPDRLEPRADTRNADLALSQAEAQGWFNRQALIDSGIDAAQADELKGYFERLEIERLHLRDKAERDNWSRESLVEAMRALDEQENDLQNRLGESAYDAYLYASGQTNRIAVASVLDTAQAGTVGIRSGDHIIRYANERIYNWRDLRTAISDGNAGDSVMLEIERNGKRLEFYLARGPLGIRTTSLSIAP